MAKAKPWWPRKIELQLAFWLNFISKLGTYATELNITPGEITAFTKDAAMFAYLYAYEKVVRTFTASFMAYRKNLLSGKNPADIGAPPVCPVNTVPSSVFSAVLNRLFAFVILLKAQPGMTPAIAKDLQIVGADIEPFVPGDYVANGKAKVTPDGILFNFIKGLFIDGVAIFMQRGSDLTYHEVARIPKRGYLMTILNLIAGPEIRNFKTRAFIGNTLIGEYSPIFTVTYTSPPPPPTAAAKNDATAVKE